MPVVASLFLEYMFVLEYNGLSTHVNYLIGPANLEIWLVRKSIYQVPRPLKKRPRMPRSVHARQPIDDHPLPSAGPHQVLVLAHEHTKPGEHPLDAAKIRGVDRPVERAGPLSNTSRHGEGVIADAVL